MADNKMIPSRNTTHQKDVTMAPNPKGTEGGQTSEGEGFGVGTRHSAVLNERPNKSLNRNNGADRPSANAGTVPMVTKSDRKTGRV